MMSFSAIAMLLVYLFKLWPLITTTKMFVKLKPHLPVACLSITCQLVICHTCRFVKRAPVGSWQAATRSCLLAWKCCVMRPRRGWLNGWTEYTSWWKYWINQLWNFAWNFTTCYNTIAHMEKLPQRTYRKMSQNL